LKDVRTGISEDVLIYRHHTSCILVRI